MRGYLRDLELLSARTVPEALGLLDDTRAERRPFAGGTDLMVLLAAGSLQHHRFVSIWGIEELRAVEVSPAFVTVGALATFSDVRRSAVLRREFPLLCDAAAEVGGVANQNRATLGGNIANASPAADASPALMVYGAELELVSAGGSRRIPYAQFHLGYKQLDLRGNELIARIRLARPTGEWVQEFRKVGTRRAQAISKVCFAAAAQVRDGHLAQLALAFGSLGPTVLRATRAETMLRGVPLTRPIIEEAVQALPSELSPIDDIRSTARHRTRVAQNLAREFLLKLAGSAPSGRQVSWTE